MITPTEAKRIAQALIEARDRATQGEWHHAQDGIFQDDELLLMVHFTDENKQFVCLAANNAKPLAEFCLKMMEEKQETALLLSRIHGACEGIELRQDMPDTVRAWARKTAENINAILRGEK